MIFDSNYIPTTSEFRISDPLSETRAISFIYAVVILDYIFKFPRHFGKVIMLHSETRFSFCLISVVGRNFKLHCFVTSWEKRKTRIEREEKLYLETQFYTWNGMPPIGAFRTVNIKLNF